MASSRLGELLVARGLVSVRELADALAMPALSGGLLGQLLIRIGALSDSLAEVRRAVGSDESAAALAEA